MDINYTRECLEFIDNDDNIGLTYNLLTEDEIDDFFDGDLAYADMASTIFHRHTGYDIEPESLAYYPEMITSALNQTISGGDDIVISVHSETNDRELGEILKLYNMSHHHLPSSQNVGTNSKKLIKSSNFVSTDESERLTKNYGALEAVLYNQMKLSQTMSVFNADLEVLDDFKEAIQIIWNNGNLKTIIDNYSAIPSKNPESLVRLANSKVCAVYCNPNEILNYKFSNDYYLSTFQHEAIYTYIAYKHYITRNVQESSIKMMWHKISFNPKQFDLTRDIKRLLVPRKAKPRNLEYNLAPTKLSTLILVNRCTLEEYVTYTAQTSITFRSFQRRLLNQAFASADYVTKAKKIEERNVAFNTRLPSMKTNPIIINSNAAKPASILVSAITNSTYGVESTIAPLLLITASTIIALCNELSPWVVEGYDAEMLLTVDEMKSFIVEASEIITKCICEFSNLSAFSARDLDDPECIAISVFTYLTATKGITGNLVRKIQAMGSVLELQRCIRSSNLHYSKETLLSQLSILEDQEWFDRLANLTDFEFKRRVKSANSLLPIYSDKVNLFLSHAYHPSLANAYRAQFGRIQTQAVDEVMLKRGMGKMLSKDKSKIAEIAQVIRTALSPYRLHWENYYKTVSSSYNKLLKVLPSRFLSKDYLSITTLPELTLADKQNVKSIRTLATIVRDRITSFLPKFMTSGDESYKIKASLDTISLFSFYISSVVMTRIQSELNACLYRNAAISINDGKWKIDQPRFFSDRKANESRPYTEDEILHTLDEPYKETRLTKDFIEKLKEIIPDFYDLKRPLARLLYDLLPVLTRKCEMNFTVVLDKLFEKSEVVNLVLSAKELETVSNEKVDVGDVISKLSNVLKTDETLKNQLTNAAIARDVMANKMMSDFPVLSERNIVHSPIVAPKPLASDKRVTYELFKEVITCEDNVETGIGPEIIGIGSAAYKKADFLTSEFAKSFTAQVRLLSKDDRDSIFDVLEENVDGLVYECIISEDTFAIKLLIKLVNDSFNEDKSAWN